MMATRIRTISVICVDAGAPTGTSGTDGDDPTGVIVREVLPRAAASGLVSRRIGIAGESMGGYGAIWLAQRIGAPRVAAVAALSRAIFASYADARAADAAAFDGQQDVARNAD